MNSADLFSPNLTNLSFYWAYTTRYFILKNRTIIVYTTTSRFFFKFKNWNCWCLNNQPPRCPGANIIFCTIQNTTYFILSQKKNLPVLFKKKILSQKKNLHGHPERLRAEERKKIASTHIDTDTVTQRRRGHVGGSVRVDFRRFSPCLASCWEGLSAGWCLRTSILVDTCWASKCRGL
jgi:hypothetical protein